MEGLKLRILRATSLGYDDFDPDSDLARSNYDLTDPMGMDISFDQRFVEMATGNTDSTIAVTYKRHEFDTKAYQTLYPNTTSQFKRSIDGCFRNHNEQALQELHRMIEVADKGMRLITDEIVRSHEAPSLVAP